MSKRTKESWDISDSDGNSIKFTKEEATATVGAIVGSYIAGPVGTAIGAGIGVVVGMIIKDKKN